MTTNHQWELMLPKEFYEEMTKAPIAYLSFGPMEEHGLHCSMGTDFQISRELCLRAARISGGIAHPTVPLAQPWFPGLSRKEIRDKVIELYPPSLWISRELLESICLEMLESLSELGFKLCVAVSGHYPGEVLLQALEKKIVGKVGPMKFWGTGSFHLSKIVLQVDYQKNPGYFGHGTMWETSCVMAVSPESVELGRVDAIRKDPFVSQLQNETDDTLRSIREASAEFGEKFYQPAAAYLAREAVRILGEKTKVEIS